MAIAACSPNKVKSPTLTKSELNPDTPLKPIDWLNAACTFKVFEPVRISDVIAYIGRDIEDAIMLGDIRREDLPSDVVTVLGNKNSSIVETLEDDLIENSIGKNYLCFSDRVFNALKILMNWNYKNIYDKASLSDKALLENKFDRLFDVYLEKLTKSDYKMKKIKNSNVTYSDKVLRDFIEGKTEEYLEKTDIKRIVIDYISGFTDNFFNKEYEIYK